MNARKKPVRATIYNRQLTKLQRERDEASRKLFDLELNLAIANQNVKITTLERDRLAQDTSKLRVALRLMTALLLYNIGVDAARDLIKLAAKVAAYDEPDVFCTGVVDNEMFGKAAFVASALSRSEQDRRKTVGEA